MDLRLTPYAPIIYCVDNKEIDLKYMKRGFQGEGFTVICETSPVKALDYVQDTSNPLDLFFTDLRMPEIDGIELAK